MSDTVIKAENLGKKYLIGHQSHERYTTLRDVLVHTARNTLHKTRQLLSGQQLLEGDSVEEFWALKDVGFEIKRGDRVGIIGRNGAGKSTLLKILSRITEPSAGRVEITGRVASLLEVGTGFHPELTGRENIYLNGAILGMTRAEIKRKFDEIVDFAGVEKFLDTPVKRYSSGMYVRLAFSVAAHLEPEILVVDEVLAVGDAEFQKKCLGKMEDVSKGEGRTVLFVSHNMEMIRQLCNFGILLEAGQVINQGDKEMVLHAYLQQKSILSNKKVDYDLARDITLQLLEVRHIEEEQGIDIAYQIILKFKQAMRFSGLAILIYNELQQRVGIVDLREALRTSDNHQLSIKGFIHDNPLIEGKYRVGLYLQTSLNYGNFLDLAEFQIPPRKQKSELVAYPIAVRGLVEFKHSFEILN